LISIIGLLGDPIYYGKEWNLGDPASRYGVWIVFPALLNKRFFRGGRGYLKVNTIKLILLTNDKVIGSDFVR